MYRGTLTPMTIRPVGCPILAANSKGLRKSGSLIAARSFLNLSDLEKKYRSLYVDPNQLQSLQDLG